MPLGYFMPNRQLFENFDSVLLFAFVGTIWNTFAIGKSFIAPLSFNAALNFVFKV